MIAPGESLALVGESGSGKSSVALALFGLLPAGTEITGGIEVAGVEVTSPEAPGLAEVRGGRAGLVLQDPASSFNPLMRVRAHLQEAWSLHHRSPPERGWRAWAAGLLSQLQVDDAGTRMERYPHAWSGGMLQRAAIACADANEPTLLVADEPTASLDLPLALDVVEALRAHQRERGSALLLITHQLGLVGRAADRVAVMYAGRVVETGPADPTLRTPRHPYTRALLRAMPRLEGRPAAIPGEAPSGVTPPEGCAFHTRCSHAVDWCRVGPPPALVDGVACPVVSGRGTP